MLLVADGEPGADVYSAAGDRDQARMVFDLAREMVLQSEDLSRIVKPYRNSLVVEQTASAYHVISAEAKTKHGKNAHGIIFDELHVQPNRDLWDVLTTSTGSRMQPLTVAITTAGFDKHSICWEVHDYACKVRDGIIDDPAFLPVIYAADEDADWTGPKVWAKANPNLGISLSEEYLAAECKRAQEVPAYENTFRRLHLNQWTEQDVRWLKMESWDNCCGEMPDMEGCVCYAGLDLSSKIDLTALVLVFPLEGGGFVILPHFFCPAENARERERRDKVPYTQWARDGYLEATPGNVIDYEFIKAKLRDLAKQYDIQEVAYDPWSATQIALQLQDEGFKMVEFRQGYKSMSEPAKEFERSIMADLLLHDGNPVMRWMVSNVSIDIDPAGNVKPSKKKSIERIDGIPATLMALGRHMLGADTTSVYESRGILTL